MKTDKKILLAFCLNFFFSIIEFVGGIVTGSVAIASDAIHDFGDSLSIGMSYVFEKISMKKPNEKYTFGYYRYSVLGSIIQSVILICGSVFVMYNASLRLITPRPIDYDGMIVIAIAGFIVNFFAAYYTSGEGSLNQKSINLHMLEDVIGWAIVLVGAVAMRFTDWNFLDALLSVALAVFIIINALINVKSALDVFLEKAPGGICMNEVRKHLLSLDAVSDIHHFHVWSMDGYRNAATLHVVTDSDIEDIKQKVKGELSKFGISHTTVECEHVGEACNDKCCVHDIQELHRHHHHHH